MDMSKYLEMFLEESREHLQRLNESLLELETGEEAAGILDDIFRSAHTLKGMSATMGFAQVAELTHQMENVLHALRRGEMQVNSGVIDLLFKCVDTLDGMVNDIAAGGDGSIPVDDLVAELKAGMTSGVADTAPKPAVAAGPVSNITKVTFNEFEKNLVEEALEQGYICVHITVNISPKCIMKSARAFMVFKKLEEIGEIIKTVPPVQDIEEEKFDTGFDVVMVSKEPVETIKKQLLSVTEVEEPEITVIEGKLPKSGPVVPEADVQPTPAPPEQKTEEKPQAKPARPHQDNKPKTSGSVRVDIHRLDSLMNLVGELVINKTRLEQIGKETQSPELNETLEQIDRITADLQNVVMKVRMVPIDNVFSRFPRMVRDLARELGKEIELVIEGKDTELDRTVIDEIGDPLVHLLRNCVDHGVELPADRLAAGKSETGHVYLVARHEGNNVVIEVADDGKGLNPEVLKRKVAENGLAAPEEIAQMDENSLLKLIFLPGFSTAEKVTDVSGRGVGMDAVKNKIEALSGNIFIESKPGSGTSFKIQLPLTLAIIQALLVRLEAEIYAIPLSFIAETTSIMPDQINRVQEQEVMLLRGDVLPLLRLHEILQVPPADLPKEEEINVVIVRKGERRVGLIVDTLIGQQEIVIKPLGELIGSIPVIAGATILGNGRVSLIIDVASLF
ncbi:MAG: chemotaxis protein CheW [Bacillota bacterium]